MTTKNVAVIGMGTSGLMRGRELARFIAASPPVGVLIGKLDDVNAKKFRDDWEKYNKETGFAIFNTTDNFDNMGTILKLRIPRKLKKRLIGTNNRHILTCTTSTFRQRMDTGRKYFIQISKK